MTALLWLRRDLRLADHPALLAAAQDGPVLPVFVLDPALWRGAGPVRQAALSAALRGYAETLADLGGHLVVRTGRPARVIRRLAAEVGAGSVHVSVESTPYGRRRDAATADAVSRDGVRWVATGSPYAVGPGLVLTGGGTPYQVFTPFSKAWREHGWPAPAARPTRGDVRWVTGVPGETLPVPEATGTSGVEVEVSEAFAHARWRAFVRDDLADYVAGQNRPDHDATSRMSIQLKYGTIHPRTLLADLAPLLGGRDAAVSAGAQRFMTELAWREFYADVLWHRPDSAWADLRPALSRMAYDDPVDGAGPEFEAWRAGRTGYPLVDAGMRQLHEQGWMHNRVRMVTASFLVKDLHIWWPHGARVFLDLLADGDLASNNHGWQWMAGTGTDAAPYFRVFNPVSQGKKFDPTGDYVRRFVPELRHISGVAVHEPWRASDGYAHGYPERIVDHDEERREALARYDAARNA